MSDQAAIIVAPLPALSLNPEIARLKLQALEKAALIGKVTDRDSKIIAVRAQQDLKRVSSTIEKGRKEGKEPMLQACRKWDTHCESLKLDVDKEEARVGQAIEEFDLAERRRVAEEERLQREEIARIEREKQAELARIAREQAEREAAARRAQEEIERKAREAKAEAERIEREAREAAEKLAREATNKKQREAAEKARVEAAQRAEAARVEAARQAEIARVEKEKQDAILREQAEAARLAAAAIEEKAGDATYCAARPIEITKVSGQVNRSDWAIEIQQPFVLAKFHPDLVDIKPRLLDIKNALNEGREIKGIKAERKHISSVRLAPERQAIEV